MSRILEQKQHNSAQKNRAPSSKSLPANSVLAYAKVNLFLHVIGKRDDGYHLLESLIGFVDVGDQLTITPLEDTSDIQLDISGPYSYMISQEDPESNLVVRAARLLQSLQTQKKGAHITLEKNLPVAAGIGGGSADAAAALLLLNTLWDMHVDIATLSDRAVRLGADIPVCLRRKLVMVEGIGEHVTPVFPSIPSIATLLVNPNEPLATPAVFRQLTKRSAPLAASEKTLSKVTTLSQFFEYLHNKSNDLEQPALEILPMIGDIIQRIQVQAGCRYARMSGSGATCFGLFESEQLRDQAAAYFTKHHPTWWVQTGMLEV